MERKPMSKSFTIGLDLGGTKVAAGLVDHKGALLDHIKVPVEMGRESSPLVTQKRVMALMADLAHDFKKRFPKETSGAVFKGVGLASAGPLNAETGKLIHPVNFPGWKVYPIQENLTKELHRRSLKAPVYFQNDAIAAALAESWVGAAKGLKTFAVVTVGTGIGSGVLVHGKPCHTKGMGSEFGHTVVDFQKLKAEPNKLNQCTVEGVASGTGLLRRAHEMGFNGKSVEELVMAYENGEKRYQVLFDDMAWALAVLCYDLSVGFHLEKILFSGGLLKIKHLFFEPMKAHYVQLIQQFNKSFEAPLQIAKGGTHAGVIGAAYLPHLR
jgi:glucokinase